jgi:hypothetical protein
MFMIDKKNRIAVFAHEGLLYLEEVLTFLKDLRNHPDYSEGIAVIYDFRKTSLKPINTKELEFLRKQVFSHPELLIRDAAMVAEDPLEYGICRMWMAHMASIPSINRMLFKDFEEARKWLLDLREPSKISESA